MALTPEQRNILAQIKRIGRQRGASPKEVKAAIETGLVESNLSNPSGGDADSAGWRQERRSLYRDPTNVAASINRFFDETGAVKGKYGRAGDLAAAVQRPAAQYRSRYQGVSGEASALMGRTGSAPGVSTSVRATTPGVDNSQARRAAIAQFLGDKNADPVNFAMQVRALRDVPGKTTTTSRSASRGAAAGGASSGKRSKLLELFYQGPGGVDVKNGVKEPQGFVSGHTDHVHLAAGPKTVVDLGRIAQRMGLHVGENPHFGGVNPVHVTGSYHYKGEAIDVSGDPAQMRHFAAYVAHLYGIKVRGNA